jgi:hypothetical protein
LKAIFGCCAALLLAGPLAALAKTPAPTQRRLPDWSGVWQSDTGILFNNSNKGEDPETPAPPYTPEYMRQFQAVIDGLKQGVAVDDKGAACIPPGMPRIMFQNYPFELIVTPKEVWTLHEYESQVRRIYTDGRKHPADPDPSYNGHSIGHWEGDTLVVDTVGLRGDLRIDRQTPHSDQLRVTERIRRVDRETLEDRITLIDPKALTRPWRTTRTYKRHPDWVMSEFVCEENNRPIFDNTPPSAAGGP